MGVLYKIRDFVHSSIIKGFFVKIRDFIKVNYRQYILWMALPFMLMDVFIYIFGSDISYVSYNVLSPVFFSLAWIILFVFLPLCFKRNTGRFLYLLFSILFLALFLVNNVYYSMTKTFFDFSLMESAGEGAPYMIEAIKNCNPLVYVAFSIIVVFIINGFKKIPENKKSNHELALVVIVIFVTLYSSMINALYSHQSS